MITKRQFLIASFVQIYRDDNTNVLRNDLDYHSNLILKCLHLAAFYFSNGYSTGERRCIVALKANEGTHVI